MRALLVFAGLALALLVFEVALRITQAERSRMFRFDSRTIYELIPDTKRLFTHMSANGGHSVRMHINSDGFRGGEIEEAPDRRVVVYGDSSIQAEFSSREATFVAQLGDRLNRRCPWEVEAVNAGVIGFGPDQVLRKMETELPLLQPDLVINTLFADNDFGDLLRNKIFFLSPDGDLEENDLRLTRSLKRALGLQTDLATVYMARKAYWRWLAWRKGGQSENGGESRVGSDRFDQWLKESREEYASYVERGDRVVRDIYYDHYDADISLAPDSESARYKIRLMNKVLQRMGHVLRESKVEGLLLIIPPAADICEDYDFEVDESRYPEYDSRALSRSVEQGAEKSNLHYLSLWTIFQENRPNSLYFHHGDNHWNDSGQALAATAVANRIADRYWPECQGSK